MAQVLLSLAADAPITALTARRLGATVHLVRNPGRVDPTGQAVLDAPDTATVSHHAVPGSAAGSGTPQLTIVTDAAGTRMWFAWLGEAVDQLIAVDLTPLAVARLGYIDCYRTLDAPAPGRRDTGAPRWSGSARLAPYHVVMRVLVAGSGGREHAIAVALAADPAVAAVASAPGNPGMGELGRLFAVDPLDADAVAGAAMEFRADLVVVGPEAALVAGVTDAVQSAGIACFGPTRRAAQLEGSKSFAKEVMAAAGVPTARSRSCSTTAEVAAALDEFGAP